MYPTNYNYYPTQANQQPSQVPQYQSTAYLRQAPPQTGLKGRLVASLEEARATSIDFDGSVFYFPDLANRRIYTKQINMDGTATLSVYELKEMPVEPVPADMNQFITREEFEQTLEQFRQSFVQPVVQAPPDKKPEVFNF